MKRKGLYGLACVVLIALLTALFAMSSFGADTAFEKSISAFPESYRVKMRELHQLYPSWEFQPLDTGLDWNEVVTVESSGGRSVVEISGNYTNLFKSKNTGDYNYSSGAYIQKDGGFCTANKFAVSYFLDPRNFLNEENVFQFELLSFDDSFTVEAVDVVLSGTFMYNKKMTYLTSSGETKTIDQTYAQAIYEAGKTYNVNPCFLASKIRSEVGSTGSGSVSGKNSTYPGIYNFYNIGASDGAGAITRGLAWAANGKDGTYGRPWTTPKKSILGGAEYLAKIFIGKGQNTGYYQRFCVNPDSAYGLYNHQYMTNISGACVQAYSSYRSYLSMGLLGQHFVFSVPIYRNMPGSADNTGTLKLADAASQTVEVSLSSASSVRTGPSTNYDKMAFTLAPGTNLTVLGAYPTDSRYYDSILRYPVWYQVKFVYDGTAYKGFIPCGFTTPVSTKTVSTGLYTPKYSTGNKSLYFKYVSLDARICSVVDDTKLNFLKEGSCVVLAYDASGRFAMVKYVVSASAPPNDTSAPVVTTNEVGQVRGLQETKVGESSFTLSWSPLAGATGYRVYQYNPERGKNDVVITTKKTSYTFKNLASGTTLEVCVKAYSKASGSTVWGTASNVFSAKTLPPGPEKLTQSASSASSVTLTWSAVDGARLYQLVRYDDDRETFVSVQKTEGRTLNVSSLLPSSSYWFKVRAVVSIGGKNYYTPYSLTLTARTGPVAVTGLRQTAAKTDSVTLQWNAMEDVDGYRVFRRNLSNGSLIELGDTATASYTVQGLSAGEQNVFVVKAFTKQDGITCEGTASDELLTTTTPEKVAGVRQYSTKRTCLKLTWSPVKGASGYCVYRVSDTGSRKKVANVASNKALIKKLSAGTSYHYDVRAYIRVDGKVYWGAYSDRYTAHTNPA